MSLDIENHIPLDGNLNFLISNSSKFPQCLDSLTSGMLEEQASISTTCKDTIDAYYGGADIVVECENGQCLDFNFHYVEFQYSDETIFFGKLAQMDLLIPDEIDDLGYVLNPSSYKDSLNLLGDKLDWLSKDDILYIAPQVNLIKTDSTDDELRTLRSTDYMSFQSGLRLEIDMGDVLD